MGVRVFIIDEHTAVRESLSRRLANMPDIVVVGSTGDGEEGLRRINELRPDVVLVDTKMKKADGIDLCRRVGSSPNGAKVTVLTSFADPEERRLALQAGVFGYLLKDVDTAKLAKWIRRLAEVNGR